MRRFESFDICHVLRAQNATADSLCNAALDIDDFLVAWRLGGAGRARAVLTLANRLSIDNSALKDGSDVDIAEVIAELVGMPSDEMLAAMRQ